mmetsp:Transcript_32532/g.47483  ORF Transcript_32532/g.47483 Transcript_32532/m.47483 type:complete len:227 (-) Transcript_32532:814-1494(-)
MRRGAHVLEERVARHKRACTRFALKHLRISAPTAPVANISLWLSLPLFAHAYPVIRTSNRRRKRKIGKIVFVFSVSFVPLPPTCFLDRTTAPTRGFKRVVVLVSIKNRGYFAPRFGVGDAHEEVGARYTHSGEEVIVIIFDVLIHVLVFDTLFQVQQNHFALRQPPLRTEARRVFCCLPSHHHTSTPALQAPFLRFCKVNNISVPQNRYRHCSNELAQLSAVCWLA